MEAAARPGNDFDFGRISAKLRLQLAPRIESGCRRAARTGDLSSDSAEKSSTPPIDSLNAADLLINYVLQHEPGAAVAKK